jgi:nucleoid DNA-binding protein
MNPKKSNKLYTEVSEDLNLKEDQVEDIIEFYYKEVRRNLSDLLHPRINLDGLGHFVAKPVIIRNAISRNKMFLDVQRTDTFAEYFNKKNTKTKLDSLITLESKLTEIENKKEIFKQTKYDKYTKDNLEE